MVLSSQHNRDAALPTAAGLLISLVRDQSRLVLKSLWYSAVSVVLMKGFLFSGLLAFQPQAKPVSDASLLGSYYVLPRCKNLHGKIERGKKVFGQKDGNKYLRFASLA